jgi:hypothetical protein
MYKKFKVDNILAMERGIKATCVKTCGRRCLTLVKE